MGDLKWSIREISNGKGVEMNVVLLSSEEKPTFRDMLDVLINVIAPKVRRGETESESRMTVLDKSGFDFHIKTCCYVNLEKKKLFSPEAIGVNSIEWLKVKIEEDSIPNDWQIYFKGSSPTGPHREEILEGLK